MKIPKSILSSFPSLLNTWTPQVNLAKERAQFVIDELINQRNQISPVYRFKGGSERVRNKPGARGPSTHADAHPPARTPTRAPRSVRDRFSKLLEPSSLLVGGLGFVIFASIAGPMMAKHVNYIDPLDQASDSR